MFKFLKDKLKKAVGDISEKIEEEGVEEVKEEENIISKEDESSNSSKEQDKSIKEEALNENKKEEKTEKKGFFSKIFSKKEEGPEDIENLSEDEIEEIKPEELKKEAKEAEEKIKESIKKNEAPRLQDLAQRKEEDLEKKKKEEAKEKKDIQEKNKEEIKVKAKFSKDEKERIEKDNLEQKELKTLKKIREDDKEDKIKDREIENSIKSEDEIEYKEKSKQETEYNNKNQINTITKSEHKKEKKKENIEKEDVLVNKEDIEKQNTEKKGFFSKIKEKITTKKISESQFEDIFWELEVVLLENNVAVEVIEKIKEDLKKALVDEPIPRGKIEEKIIETLKNTIEDLFIIDDFNFIEKIKTKKPFVICFFGINGSGKTTSIAKIANYLKENNLSCMLAAADTFRAAAIDQLTEHANKLNVPIVKHDYGSDPAAVSFDAIKSAKSKGIDVVLIDTAGRMHSNSNLMDEMKKIIRVANPDLKVFVGESITGNDCTEQAQKFNEAVGLDGIILSKSDIDEKGGASISVSYVTKKPIIFIGTGQEYSDIKKFDSSLVIESLGL